MATPQISTDTIVRHTMELMRMRLTTQEAAQGGLRYMADLLAGHDIGSQPLSFEEGQVLVAEVGRSDAPVRVDWCGHMDVVPALREQFEPKLDGGRLVGRGSYDMLASVVTVAETLPYAADAGKGLVKTRLVLVDKEEGYPPYAFAGYMADALAKRALPDVVVIGEPTNLEVARATKGAILLSVTIHGIGGHSSIPFRLSNPIPWGMELAQKIERMAFTQQVSEDYPEGPSVALTAFNAGGAPGTHTTIPDEASFWMTIRLLPGQDTGRVLNLIEVRAKQVAAKMLAERTSRDLPLGPDLVTVKTTALRPPSSVAANNPFLVALCEAVRPHLPAGAPVLRVQHGAGDVGFAGEVPAMEWGIVGGGHHGSDEWADVSSFGPYGQAFLDYLGILADTARRPPELLKRLQAPRAVTTPCAGSQPSEPLVRASI